MYRDLTSGQTYEFWINAQGSRKRDAGEAAREAMKINKKFPGNDSFGDIATWHHAEFDSAAGRMRMQLVRYAPHRSGHSGAMADFFDWVADNADSLGTNKFENLNKTQQQALLNALLSTKDKQLSRKLSKKGIKLAREGGEVVVERGRNVLGKLSARKVGERVLGRLASGAGIYFFISAVTGAKANGRDNAAAMAAGMREMVDADMWEAGFRMTVVSGSETIWKGAVPSAINNRPTAKRLWPLLTEGERRSIIEKHSHVQFEGLYKTTGESKVSLRDALDDLWKRLP